VNVTEEILPVPIGMWPKDKKLVCIPLSHKDFDEVGILTCDSQREIGAWNFVCLEEGLEAVCIRLFTSVLGWSNEEVQVFLAGVRAELNAMKQNKWHFQYT